MNEIWKTIPETEGLYEASSLGRIRSKDRPVVIHCKCGEVIRNSLKKGRILKPWSTCHGYPTVYICANDERKAFNVHRLVARAFHGDGGDLIVNHIDGNKANNRPENLEWATYSENLFHAGRLGLRSDLKPIVGTPVNGGPDLRFPSAAAAGRHFKVYSHANIAGAATGRSKTAYGYRWKYEDELEPA